MKSIVRSFALGAILLSSGAHAISLGTVEVQSEVGGIGVVFPIALDLTVSPQKDSVQLDIAADVSMVNLQASFDTIVKRLPMPSENCPSYGQHVLPTIESASLVAAGNNAVVNAVVNVVAWDCQAIWKYIILQEGFIARLPLSLTSPDGSVFELHPGAATVTPRGDLGKIIDRIAGIFNSDVSSAVQGDLHKVLDAGAFRQALPEQILAYSPLIKSAEFRAAQDGKLLVHIDFQASITGAQIAELISKSVGQR